MNDSPQAHSQCGSAIVVWAAALVMFCAPAVAQVTITPVPAPPPVLSLGDAGVYVDIAGIRGGPQEITFEPGGGSHIEWLVPESLRLHRWKPRDGSFLPIDLDFDTSAGVLRATVPSDGVYGVFGLSRAQHIFKVQEAICAQHPGPDSGDNFRVQLLDATTEQCPIYLCPDLDVIAWAREWSRILGRTVTSRELGKMLRTSCAVCQSDPPKDTDFPECLDRPQAEFVTLESEIIPLPPAGSSSRCRDSDWDGLCDRWEILRDLNPDSKDTDGDGLEDDWEVLGYDQDGDGFREVDLATLGADPRHKDLLVEIDWTFDDIDGDSKRNAGTATELPNDVTDLCNGETSYGPIRDLTDRAKAVFAGAPVANPDGLDGINLIIAVSPEGIAETDAQNVIDGLWVEGSSHPYGVEFTTAFHDFKDEHADLLPPGISRYSLWLRVVAESDTSTGLTEKIPGPNFVVSVGFMCESSATRAEWVQNANAGMSENEVISDLHLGTFLHELGHTLGLFHGGSKDPDCGLMNPATGELWERNYEPNYQSLMNTRHQFSGTNGSLAWNPPTTLCPEEPPKYDRLDNESPASPNVMCFTRGTQRVWEFSTGGRKYIDESDLHENGGIPDVNGLHGDVDWDGNGSILQAGTVEADLDFDDCDDQVLTDNDDWSSMILRIW